MMLQEKFRLQLLLMNLKNLKRPNKEKMRSTSWDILNGTGQDMDSFQQFIISLQNVQFVCVSIRFSTILV